MSNSHHQNYHTHEHEHGDESQCPQCGNRYSQSASSQSSQSSGSQERFLIPIHQDLLQKNGIANGTEDILKDLQKQIENLKLKNIEKDRIIEQMKRQMDHKMAHYALYGEINRQNQQISRLRNQLYFNTKNQAYYSKTRFESQADEPLVKKKKKNGSVDIEYGFTQNKNKYRSNESSCSFGNDFNLKSTFNIKKNPQTRNSVRSASKPNKITQNISFHKKINTERSDFLERQSNDINLKPKYVFKISEAKRRIEELQSMIKAYEEQFLWLKNFANSFINAMQKIGGKKHGQKIFLERWGLKKKVKVSWRYLKQLLAYLYAE